MQASPSANNAIPASNPYQILEANLICPLDKVPLKNAVAVVPCGDKIQAAAAERFLGQPTSDGWKVPSGLQCPVCKLSAEGYIVDKQTRNVANTIFSAANPQGFVLQAVEKGSIERLVYPCVPATFEHYKGDWEQFGPNHDLCRQLDFKATNKDSFIQKMKVSGFKQGDVRILITFDPKKADEFFNFVEKSGIHLRISRGLKLGGNYRTNDKAELRGLFKVISENNTIPADKLEKVRTIVELGEIPAMEASRSSSPDLPGLHQLLSGLRRPNFGGDPIAEMLMQRLMSDLADAHIEPQAPIPFPGKPATFKHAEGNWEQFTPIKDLCRKMVFKSETPDSLVREFHILGYIQGRVKIYFEYDKSKTQDIESYFLGQGEKLRFAPHERVLGVYRTDNESELKAVFKMLRTNNTIPAEHLDNLQKIIDAGKIPATEGSSSRHARPAEADCHPQ